jgi:hypothetical protein
MSEGSSKEFCRIRDLIVDAIVHDEYREKNPEIDEFNVFSISTLAYDPMVSNPHRYSLTHGSGPHICGIPGKFQTLIGTL